MEPTKAWAWVNHAGIVNLKTASLSELMAGLKSLACRLQVEEECFRAILYYSSTIANLNEQTEILSDITEAIGLIAYEVKKR